MGFLKNLFGNLRQKIAMNDDEMVMHAKDLLRTNNNPALAINYLENAALRNHAEAQLILAGIHHDAGKDEEAFYWYKSAASHGNRDAQFAIGARYQCGMGVKKNEDAAFEWYKKAADQGHAEAQLSVAMMYDDTTDSPSPLKIKNIPLQERQSLCVMYLTRAADQGNKKAVDSLKRRISSSLDLI